MALAPTSILNYAHLLSNGGIYGSNSMVTGHLTGPLGPNDGPDNVEAAAMLLRAQTAFVAHIIPLMFVTWSLVGTNGSMKAISPIGGDEVPGSHGFWSLPSAVPGTRGTGTGPPTPGTAAIIEWQATPDVEGFRAIKGRWYLPGALQSADYDTFGVITPTRRSAIDAAATAYVNALIATAGTGTPSTPVNYRRRGSNAQGAYESRVAPVVAVEVNTIASYQRSRQRRR